MFRPLTLATIGLAALTAVPAAAEVGPCGDRDSMIEALRDIYGERRQAMGTESTEGLIEIFASEETGSFTVILTQAEGTSCVVAAGDNWTAALTEAAGQGVSY